MNIFILKFNLNKRREVDQVVKKAVAILRSGGIVVHPTDTCYGITADINSKKAVKKVYAFKGRDLDKPLSILVKDFGQFKRYGKWYPIIEKIIKKYSQSYFTFVVPRKKTVPQYLNPGFSNIGIRLTKNNFLLSLVDKFGSPLTATSANLSGQENNYSVKDLVRQLKKGGCEYEPDLILDAGQLPFRKASMVIEIINNKEFKILREGELSAKQFLNEIYNKPI